MRLRYPQFAACLALLLVLSQWLSLAHATEHLLTSQDTGCQVCALQNHHHAATVNLPAVALSLPEIMFDSSGAETFYPAVLHSPYGIRAPPLTSHN